MRSLTFDSRRKVDQVLDGIDAAMGVADSVMSLDAGGLIGAALGPKPTVQFTIMLRDAGSFGAFRLFAGNQPLSQKEPLLAEDVLYTIERLEAAALLRRCAFGWGGDVNTLLATPSSDIVARFQSVMGEFDPTILGRPRDQGRDKR